MNYDHFFENYHLPIIDWQDSLKYEDFTDPTARMIGYREPHGLIPPSNFPAEMAAFLSNVEKWILKWKLNPDLGINIEGAVNMQSLKDVLDWRAWDLKPDEFPVMKNFTLIDYFYPEAAVGFYLEQPEKGLYYFEMDANPQPLHLDFAGYLEMIKYSRGAAYWQKCLLGPVGKSASCGPIEELNKLSPEITVEGFFELYNSLRLAE